MPRITYCAVVKRIADTLSSRPNINHWPVPSGQWPVKRSPRVCLARKNHNLVRFEIVWELSDSLYCGAEADGLPKRVTEVTACANLTGHWPPTTGHCFQVLCLNLSSKKYNPTPTTAFASPARSPRLQLQFKVRLTM